jgi:lactoylglutathione lyase
MVEWEKRVGAINLIVGDLERCTTFFREVFTLSPQYEDQASSMFRMGDTYVFLQRGAHHRDVPTEDALEMAHRGVGQFVIFVNDVDAVRAEFDRLGVATINGPEDRDWGMRTLTFADPGGYTWEITQELPDTPSSS